MSILSKIIPIILVVVIFYLFAYNIYPKYQNILTAIKKMNELKNKEKELDLNLELIQSLSQNPNIQQLLNNRSLLNAWLPLKPNIEEVIYFFHLNMRNLGLSLDSFNFGVSNEKISFNENVLPVQTITFSFSGNFGNQFDKVIDLIESYVRILNIQNISLSKNGNMNIEVEGYYLANPDQSQ